MTDNATRASLLVRALRASVTGDSAAVETLYTRDVRAWSPWMTAESAADLAAEFERRDGTFSEIDLEVAPLDVGGDYACVEWTVTMIHAGQLTLADGAVIQPTGTRVTLNGVSVAEFEGDRICSVRQYCDELAILEQLGLLTPTAD
jgi:ketosteroid isomerase-like protein